LSGFAQRPAEPSPGQVRLAVVGSGSLARASCLALSTVDGLAGVPVEVVVLARNAAAAADLCHVAQVRAVVTGRALRCTPAVVDPGDGAAVAAALGAFRPDAVLVCASAQSPWEPLDRPSAWTRALRRAGAGLALPLQAQIALVVARAARAACPGAFVVNACLPDTVNPLLDALGAPVLTGVGNVGTLAAAVQHALGLPGEGRLHVFAHHLHLQEPAAPGDEAEVRLDGAPLGGVRDLLAAQRRADRRGMNDVTGLLAARLVADLCTGATRDTHLPGVGGRPGGYPVRISGGSLALRLPAGLDEARAVRANRRWAAREGAWVDEGYVRFGSPVTETLAPLLPEHAKGFAVDEFDDVTAAMHTMRDRLRSQPATG
jgi:hypothetical protein